MLSYIVCNPSVFVQIDKSFVAGVLWNYKSYYLMVRKEYVI